MGVGVEEEVRGLGGVGGGPNIRLDLGFGVRDGVRDERLSIDGKGAAGVLIGDGEGDLGGETGGFFGGV